MNNAKDRAKATVQNPHDLFQTSGDRQLRADDLLAEGKTTATTAHLVEGKSEKASIARGKSEQDRFVKTSKNATSAQTQKQKKSSGSQLQSKQNAQSVIQTSQQADQQTSQQEVVFAQAQDRAHTQGVQSTPSANTTQPTSTQRAKAARRRFENTSKTQKAHLQDTQKRITPVEAASALTGVITSELDDTDELKGSGTLDKGARSTRRAFKAYQKHTQTQTAGIKATTEAKSISGSSAAQSSYRSKTIMHAHAMKANAAKATQATTSAMGAQTQAAVVKGIGGVASAGAGSVGGAPAAAIGAAVVAVIAAILALLLLVGSIAGTEEDPHLDNLPEGITYEMVKAAVECQELYGHPAGATLTQIVVESSGTHDGLSALGAPPHNNLFGIKYVAGYSDQSEYVSGFSMWTTQEDLGGGNMVTIQAPFCDFASPKDCIYYRSAEFLQGSRYANNALIQEAIAECSSDKMFEGLKDAGYATASNYVETLKAICEQYDFYRFDNMTLEDLEDYAAGGGVISGSHGAEYANATPEQKRIADAAMSTPFAGDGWCAAWVSNVYANAGYGSVGGNACDMYWAFCTSTNKDELQVGMIIATPHSPYGSLGFTYGHVGIYVGDNKVMHNGSSGVITQELDSWIEEYSYLCTAGWGYPPNWS